MRIQASTIHRALCALAWLISFLFGVPALHAGQFYLNLLIDPLTTAFNGIPASGGFTGTSTRSGAGTWQLYALDQLDNSFGIESFYVNLTAGPGGTIPAISNRSPRTFWDDGIDIFDAGFGALRSGTNQNPIIGAQLSPNNAPLIGGFGREASNFSAKIPAATDFFIPTNGQWGNYANSLGLGAQHPIFLAEGTYTGGAPTLDLANSSASVFTNAALTTTALVPQIFAQPNCLCGISVSYGSLNNVNAYDPGFINYTFSAFGDLPQPGPLTWGPLNFVQWAGPGFPGGGKQLPPGVAAATIDPVTHKVTWSTLGAPLGLFMWSIDVSAQGALGTGYLWVNITQVPEPSTIGLLGAGTIGGLACRRRRAHRGSRPAPSPSRDL